MAKAARFVLHKLNFPGSASVHNIVDLKTKKATHRLDYSIADYQATVDWLNERENGYPEKRKK